MLRFVDGANRIDVCPLHSYDDTMTVASAPLTVQTLENEFHHAAKPPSEFRIGIEHEKIGVLVSSAAKKGTMPLSYKDSSKTPSILKFFDVLEAHGWTAVWEGDNRIAMQKNQSSVSLEPGGQLEFSGQPHRTANAALAEWKQHLEELFFWASSQDVLFLGCGFHPFASQADLPQVPKRRYEVMRAYLPTRGNAGLDMMHRTATVQANVDYADETDAMQKLRVTQALGPLTTALFAASPLREGKPSGFQSLRAACWLDTDASRCGLLPFVFQTGTGFREYVEWALDVPMFFVRREGNYFPVQGMPFRHFLQHGWRSYQATLEDWELHLSTLFPDSRLRHYIETRTADAGPLSMVAALPCFWRGLLYDTDAFQAVRDFVKTWTFDELMALRQQVPSSGIHGTFRRFSLYSLGAELLQIATHGLQRLQSYEEVPYLEPLWAIVDNKQSVADQILALWKQTQGNQVALAQHLRLDQEGPLENNTILLG